MTGKLQAMIDQANKRTQAQRGRQFAKKATDAQLLEQLALVSRGVVDAYTGSRGVSEVAPVELLKAMAELRTVLVVVERRAK